MPAIFLPVSDEPFHRLVSVAGDMQPLLRKQILQKRARLVVEQILDATPVFNVLLAADINHFHGPEPFNRYRCTKWTAGAYRSQLKLVARDYKFCTVSRSLNTQPLESFGVNHARLVNNEDRLR